MGYEWDMNGILMGFYRDINGIWMGYEWDFIVIQWDINGKYPTWLWLLHSHGFSMALIGL